MTSEAVDTKRYGKRPVECLVLACTRAGKPFFFWSTRQWPDWQQRRLVVSLGASAAALVARLEHKLRPSYGKRSNRYLVEGERRVWCLDLSIDDCVLLAGVRSPGGPASAPQCQLREHSVYRCLCLALQSWLRRVLLSQLPTSVFATLHVRPAFDMHPYIDSDSIGSVLEMVLHHPLVCIRDLLPLSGPLLYPSQRSSLMDSMQRLIKLVEERARPVRVSACLLVDVVANGMMVARISMNVGAPLYLIMLGLVRVLHAESCVRLQTPDYEPLYLVAGGSGRYRLIYALCRAVAPQVLDEEPIRSLQASVLQTAAVQHAQAHDRLLDNLIDSLTPADLERDIGTAALAAWLPERHTKAPPFALAAIFQTSRRFVSVHIDDESHWWILAAYRLYEQRQRSSNVRHAPFSLKAPTRRLSCFPNRSCYGEQCIVFVIFELSETGSGLVQITDQVPAIVQMIADRWTGHLLQLSLHHPILRSLDQEPEWYLWSGLCRLYAR
jgi:hypothetical protein